MKIIIFINHVFKKTLKTLNEVKNHILLGSEVYIKAIVATLLQKNILKYQFKIGKTKRKTMLISSS